MHVLPWSRLSAPFPWIRNLRSRIHYWDASPRLRTQTGVRRPSNDRFQYHRLRLRYMSTSAGPTTLPQNAHTANARASNLNQRDADLPATEPNGVNEHRSLCSRGRRSDLKHGSLRFSGDRAYANRHSGQLADLIRIGSSDEIDDRAIFSLRATAHCR